MAREEERAGTNPDRRSSLMDAAAFSALAALIGATVGGLTSALASWLTQRTQARALWIGQETIRRQELYKEFIEQASKCYVDALQHDEADIPGLVTLYAKIARMRVLSAPEVVTAADQVGRKIFDCYLERNKTFLELREMVHSDSIDILAGFSEACREELESVRGRQF
jgi:hypothetical protein